LPQKNHCLSKLTLVETLGKESPFRPAEEAALTGFKIKGKVLEKGYLREVTVSDEGGDTHGHGWNLQERRVSPGDVSMGNSRTRGMKPSARGGGVGV